MTESTNFQKLLLASIEYFEAVDNASAVGKNVEAFYLANVVVREANNKLRSVTSELTEGN